MSCPEVVYQAYYPYLYQRPSTSSARPPPPPFPPFAHHPHYDRVIGGGSSSSSSGGRLSGAASEEPVGPGSDQEPARQFYTPRASASPPSPQPHSSGSVYTDEEEESGSSSRAQYVSANCVVFTHYTGDVAAVVDEHFTRALSTDTKPPSSSKDWSPMTSRNFPPSFWNSNSSSSSSSGDAGYHSAEPSMYHCGTSEPWHSHYQQYHHHRYYNRAVHEYHQHNMQYGGGLLLPAHQYKEAASWHPQHRLHDPTAAHHLDTAAAAAAAAYSAYPSISDNEYGGSLRSHMSLY